MKKLMSLMLGLSIALGSFAMFAQNSTDTTKTTTKKKAKSTKKAVAHHKTTTHSKSKAGTKTVAKKNATPVTWNRLTLSPATFPAPSIIPLPQISMPTIISFPPPNSSAAGSSAWPAKNPGI